MLCLPYTKLVPALTEHMIALALPVRGQIPSSEGDMLATYTDIYNRQSRDDAIAYLSAARTGRWKGEGGFAECFDSLLIREEAGARGYHTPETQMTYCLLRGVEDALVDLREKDQTPPSFPYFLDRSIEESAERTERHFDMVIPWRTRRDLTTSLCGLIELSPENEIIHLLDRITLSRWDTERIYLWRTD